MTIKNESFGGEDDVVGDRGGAGEQEDKAHSRLEQAPGVPRRADAELGEVGVGNPRAAEEVADMARHIPDAGDGGEGARRGGDEHQRLRCHSELPPSGELPPTPGLPGCPRRAGGGGEGGAHGAILALVLGVGNGPVVCLGRVESDS